MQHAAAERAAVGAKARAGAGADLDLAAGDGAVPLFYVPLALLHVWVALRIAGGLLVVPAVREAGAIANAAAVAVFLLTMLGTALARCNSVRRAA